MTQKHNVLPDLNIEREAEKNGLVSFHHSTISSNFDFTPTFCVQAFQTILEG